DLEQELGIRAAIGVVILLFNELFVLGDRPQALLRLVTLTAVLVNGPYYLAARTGWRPQLQAGIRVAGDVLWLTFGLWAAGGLAAAAYASVYAVLPVYTGVMFSSRACVLATSGATLAYLGLAVAQYVGAAPLTRAVPADAWMMLTFNLLVVNLVGVMSALLSGVYRHSRNRLAALYGELERAHDESLRLNSQMQHASRHYALGEIVAGVTHEVRNALQGAFGHLWLARRKIEDPTGEITEHLVQVEQSCENAMRIIRTTLDMARQTSRELEPVSLGDITRRVAELKSYDLRRDGVTLRLELADDLPVVMAAPYQLQQAILNLVNNAQEELRGRKGPREIELVGSVQGDRAVLEVRDSGPGIPFTALPHLFEPFYTTKNTGAGLGLAISAGIAEGFGGRLTAANRREGGAVFTLSLPRAPRNAGAAAPARPVSR
ncbi:MAG TPA: ATP-binding protein, partial [Methylomirabilota bacterium]|nr:ATP-binding protein [Methylomirabilota bacterium]